MKKTQRNTARICDDAIDVGELLDRVSEKRSIARQFRKSYLGRQSKLEHHRNTIMRMHRKGASLQDIAVALRSILSPRVSCAASTVKRFIDKNEIQDSDKFSQIDPSRRS